ncbi:MAG: response regulator [Nitrospirae bacterium]|nr:response regulator [Candidatus Manganitrophaceae bacterium]
MSPREQQQTNPIQILVVDDERGPRELLESALLEEGYQITAAKNGEEACQIFDENFFELVITDFKMPGLNGIKLLKKIKTRAPETLVILITGYASLASAIHAIREGAYDYLTKPFQLDELYIVVKNAVDRIKLIRENNALLMHLKQAMEKQMLPFENTEMQIGLQENNAELLESLRTQLLKVYNRSGQPYPHIS